MHSIAVGLVACAAVVSLATGGRAGGLMKRKAKALEMSASVEKIAQRYMSQDEASALVKMTSPKNDIIKALDDLSAEVRSEIIAGNLQYDAIQAQYADNILRYQANAVTASAALTAAQARLAADQADLTSTVALIASKTTSLGIANTRLSNAQSSLLVLDSNRQVAIFRHNAIITKHTVALRDLDTLIGMVTNFNFEEAMKQVKKMKTDFLHEQEGTVGSLLQSAATLISSVDPNSKNSVKQRLIVLLIKIRNGIQHSLDLYNSQEIANRAMYATSRQSQVDLIAQYTAGRDALATELASLLAHKSQVQGNIIADKSTIGVETKAVSDNQAMVVAEQARKSQSTADHEAKNANRMGDLNDIETARQFVIKNTPGMTPAEDCNVEALDCFRCLYDDHCPAGQQCSAEGQCNVPQPPILVFGSVPEHQILTLKCNEGAIITGVQFASYGTPTTANGPKYTKGNCDASTSTIVMINKCLSKTTCSVMGDNQVFGDPCVGTFKRLSATVICTQK